MPPRRTPPGNLPFAQRIEREQYDTDYVSFFVGEKTYDELTPEQVVKHNCLHLVNAIRKLSIDRKPNVLSQEVVPDLWVYGMQAATAYEVPWWEHVGVEETTRSLNQLRTSQAGRIHELLGSVEEPIDAIRDQVLCATGDLARYSDKHDHGEHLPSVDIGTDVVGPLMISSVALAETLSTDMDTVYTTRLRQIREKYGNVRRLFQKHD